MGPVNYEPNYPELFERRILSSNCVKTKERESLRLEYLLKYKVLITSVCNFQSKQMA